MEQTKIKEHKIDNEVKNESDLAEVLEVAAKAGHILLENGAEISRVEDIMGRISSHFGVDSGNFFVLSNGIFTTGRANKVTKSGGQASTYANVESKARLGANLRLWIGCRTFLRSVLWWLDGLSCRTSGGSATLCLCAGC